MIPELRNILAQIPDAHAAEAFETIAEGAAVSIERIVSRGQGTPDGEWYDQVRAEWVLLVAGAARILFENGREFALSPGDHLLIPARCRHRVTWTDPDRESVWLAVHFDPADSP